MDLAPLEKRLEKSQWLGGAKPAAEDLEQAKLVAEVDVDNKKFPYTWAWLSLAAKLQKL